MNLSSYTYNPDNGVTTFPDGVTYTLEEMLLLSRTGDQKALQGIHKVKLLFDGVILPDIPENTPKTNLINRKQVFNEWMETGYTSSSEKKRFFGKMNAKIRESARREGKKPVKVLPLFDPSTLPQI
jgi:hypothetical protein